MLDKELGSWPGVVIQVYIVIRLKIFGAGALDTVQKSTCHEMLLGDVWLEE
jgi:hypothetical protein